MFAIKRYNFIHLYKFKKVAQGHDPEEHRQLVQAMLILSYLPQHVVSYFLSSF